jgi:hypothetical protein
MPELSATSLRRALRVGGATCRWSRASSIRFSAVCPLARSADRSRCWRASNRRPGPITTSEPSSAPSAGMRTPSRSRSDSLLRCSVSLCQRISAIVDRPRGRSWAVVPFDRRWSLFKRMVPSRDFLSCCNGCTLRAARAHQGPGVLNSRPVHRHPPWSCVP